MRASSERPPGLDGAFEPLLAFVEVLDARVIDAGGAFDVQRVRRPIEVVSDSHPQGLGLIDMGEAGDIDLGVVDGRPDADLGRDGARAQASAHERRKRALAVGQLRHVAGREDVWILHRLHGQRLDVHEGRARRFLEVEVADEVGDRSAREH